MDDEKVKMEAEKWLNFTYEEHMENYRRMEESSKKERERINLLRQNNPLTEEEEKEEANRTLEVCIINFYFICDIKHKSISKCASSLFKPMT